MTGNQTFTAVLPKPPSPTTQNEEEDLARLKELERGVIAMSEMLKDGFWDTSEGSDLSGLAGRLQGEITKLWLDMEGLGEELRRASNSATQV